MPKATDTKEVKDSEFIGRSLHGKKESNVFCDKGLIKWQQFYDSRLEENLSVDRIGDKQIDKGSLTYLHPLAVSRNPEPFQGWATIKVQKITTGKFACNVIPTPILDEENANNSNELHADIDRTNFRTEQLAYCLAVALSHAVNSIVKLNDNKAVVNVQVPKTA